MANNDYTKNRWRELGVKPTFEGYGKRVVSRRRDYDGNPSPQLIQDPKQINGGDLGGETKLEVDRPVVSRRRDVSRRLGNPSPQLIQDDKQINGGEFGLGGPRRRRHVPLDYDGNPLPKPTLESWDKQINGGEFGLGGPRRRRDVSRRLGNPSPQLTQDPKQINGGEFGLGGPQLKIQSGMEPELEISKVDDSGMGTERTPWKDIAQTPLTDINDQINKPVASVGAGHTYVSPGKGGYSGGGGAGLKISSRTNMNQLKRKTWDMATVNAGSTSGKASNSSSVNV